MRFEEWCKNSFRHSERFTAFLPLHNANREINIEGLWGSSSTLFTSVLFEEIKDNILFLCKDDNEAKLIYYDLLTYGVNDAYFFPSLGVTPYHQSIVQTMVSATRMEIFKRIIEGERVIVVTSLSALIMPSIPKDILAQFILHFTRNFDTQDIDLTSRLIQFGYTRVTTVRQLGEFSVRGNILDIYFSPSQKPVRIDLFDTLVESIKYFDPDTQRSVEQIDKVDIFPIKEIVYSDKEIERATDKIKQLDGNEEEKRLIISNIKNYKRFDGEHFLMNLLYDKYSLLQYLGKCTLIINDSHSISKKYNALIRDYEDNFNFSGYHNRVMIPPNEILYFSEEIYELANKVCRINIQQTSSTDNIPSYCFNNTGIPVYSGNIKLFNEDVVKYLDQGYKIVLFSGSKSQTERFISLFKDHNPKDNRYDVDATGVSIFSLPISNGFIDHELRWFFLSGFDIFGKKRVSKHFYSNRSKIIENFMDLAVGDFVVHIHHGIGKFLGVERVKSMGVEKDYIKIAYADDDKILIPVEQLNFIQKYISNGFSKPRLDKIGAKSWQRTKDKVQKSIEELARQLVSLYSVRLDKKGFVFLPDTPWQKEFEAEFPFDETTDQLITIEEVKRDMESPQIMDRLICGDVGFGKTEVAIRAAFKGVMSGKQVIILVPTTILAEQHYNTFVDRLQNYPINVEMLSRFRSLNEQKNILELVKKGDIDILIGTHRLLSKDLIYKNPGLLIIDEEHRFGVKHKEKLKSLKQNIDTLSMTATPIPRTLHMSLSKIRDISLINTPPRQRQSVETFVMEFNEEILKDGIKRELEREGQIFFLHNRVKTIYTMYNYLKSIYSKARIIVAHGQMKEDELEEVIKDFINYKYDILLTTTIVESGIDIPRANTIFIDRANNFGLSQLYQLRGRVGRSERKAYAYLFYDKNLSITEDAMKRLRVISEYTELGSGFKIAMKDLEIRGAGNLFGPQQSGNILAVGFQMYTKLLSDAVRKLGKDRIEYGNEMDDVYLDLNYNGFIPDDYISDQKLKMEFYKKISGVTHTEELKELKESINDRFGEFPEKILPLFDIAEIRIFCKDIGVSELKERKNIVDIRFSNSNKINITKLLKLVQNSDGNLFLSPKDKDAIFIKIGNYNKLSDKMNFLRATLKRLKGQIL